MLVIEYVGGPLDGSRCSLPMAPPRLAVPVVVAFDENGVEEKGLLHYVRRDGQDDVDAMVEMNWTSMAMTALFYDYEDTEEVT